MAVIVSAPPVVVTPWSALATYAATSLQTSLKAIVTAIDTATPTTPKPAATAAAPAIALMPDESVAVISTLVALMPAGPSPSMNACTCVEIRFIAAAPAPPRLAPTTPPEIATAAATTMASIVACSSAVIDRAPAASMLESDANARTCAGYDTRSTRCHSDLSP